MVDEGSIIAGLVEVYNTAVKGGDIFEVVGGATSGGIIVRVDKEKSSAEIPERLATGSMVKVVETDGTRASYELLSGTGPTQGWVSMSAGGKPLLSKADMILENSGNDCLEKADAQEGLKIYGHRLAQAREAGKGDFLFDRKSISPSANFDRKEQTEDVKFHARGEVEARVALEEDRTRRLLATFHSGQGVKRCHHCRLPLGEYGYAKKTDAGKNLMHAECMAQTMLKSRRDEEQARKKKETELKQARREEYEIGWKVATIPSNVSSASQLGCDTIPQGLCCLVLDGETNSVRVAPTFEPAAALNLEYLSIALQVRRLEGREPLFSLDPLEATRDLLIPESSMQKKRFEPEWLAGTSVGEVMFQADYHLKELSMGEHEQPVMGMLSCFDYAKTEGFDKEWSAREWFVVRRAEMHLSEDAVLVPHLKLGVEAREQVAGPDGQLEDAPLTRPDHPLVKYAEAFTHNFDLIAERKSVVNQLREVAKASITAKFLLESGASLGEAWFKLGEPTSVSCCLEVPQLWNDHCFSKITLENGEIVTTEKANEAKVHSVYGGVDFGIDRFRLAAPSRIATSVVAGRAALGRPASTLMATSQAGLSMGPARQFTRLAAPLSARATLTAPSRLAAPLSARTGLAAPLSAMSAARPATSLMATSRLSMGAPQARLAAPLRASLSAPSRLAAPLTARAGLAAPLSAMAAARPATSLMATSRLSMGAPQARLAAPLSAMAAARPASSLMATSRISMAAPQVASARLSAGMPRGVDLNLDQFNLSAAAALGSWAGSLEAPAGSEALKISSETFFEGLEKVVAKEDAQVLLKVFEPTLSDRREEADSFVPPPTSLSYMHRLKMLVNEEAGVQKQRKDLFFSPEFSMDDAGALFPSSWTSSIQLEQDTPVESKLSLLPSFHADIDGMQDLLATSEPIFDKAVEDGTRFLAYRLGGLEIRGTKAPDSALEVGAVFAVGDRAL